METALVPVAKRELAPAFLEALAVATSVGVVPEVHWLQGDDLCDCTFQRIGEWTNPYLGRTLRVRLCCIWGEIYKQYPQFVQEVPAYYDSNRHRWVTEPREWDSEEADMPLPIWYRHLASKTGRTLADIRAEFRERASERPKAVKGKKDMPTEQEVRAATVERLRLTGWILKNQGVPAWLHKIWEKK